MSRKFTHIVIRRYNEHSRGELSSRDKEEILALLNSGDFLHREPTSDSFWELDSIDKIYRELEEEYKAIKPDATDFKIDQYLQTCHPLSRKVHKHFGWNRVCGYLFDKKKFDGCTPYLELTSHSVSQDELGNLIELLPVFFNPANTTFIQHETGDFGIDLIACRAFEKPPNTTLVRAE